MAISDDVVKAIPSNQILNPDSDPEISLPMFTDLPKEYHNVTFKMPSSEDHQAYREASLKCFQQIAQWEQEKLEKLYGEKAGKSMFHPNNRKNTPYWNCPF